MAVTVRQPRCWLLVNGAAIPCLSAEVTRKSKRSADTFSASMAIGTTQMFGMGLADWADYQPGDVSIIFATQAGAGDQTVMITGTIDTPAINWDDMTVAVSGRDKSGPLTEKRRSQKFLNQKASDIASQIAQDHGLSASVVPTSDNAGKTYSSDTAHIVLNRSDFEIMSDLADGQGYRWYVDGTTLYFEPKEQDSDVYSATWYPPGAVAPYGVASIYSLGTHRNMTAAKPHNLTVASWHHHDKKQYTSTATAGGVGSEPVEIDHHHNMRNQDQVNKLAASRLADAIRHDCNVTATGPGDLTVNARMKFQLSGTGTIYDQTYDIDSVAFQMGWDRFFEMTIEAKIAMSGRSS